jgi:dienelactone hydrolase
VATTHAGKWEAALADYTKESFEADGKRRDVYRLGSGPAVIICSEAPGMTPEQAVFGRRVAAAGCTAVMPNLFGDPGRPMTGGYALRSLGPACISREFSCFALKRTSPITSWLRQLAKAEHERCGGPGGMMVDDFVLAPVLSQPSQPFPVTKKHKADIGISDEDLTKVKARTEAGQCVLGLRFSNDPFCFEARFETLRRELGDKFIAVEIDSAPGNPYGHDKRAHSVLTHHLQDEPGAPTREALDKTLAFFRENLGVGSGPGPRPEGMGP